MVVGVVDCKLVRFADEASYVVCTFVLQTLHHNNVNDNNVSGGT